MDEREDFLYAGSKGRLILESKGHAVHAFINQELQGFYLTLSSDTMMNFLWFVTFAVVNYWNLMP